jgi:hypothetical protein
VTEYPPEQPGAVRLTFAYQGDDVRLISMQPVDAAVPPGDPVTGYQGEQGFWVETRTADGTTLHRRVMPDPFRGDAEVFSDDPRQSLGRVPIESPSGTFSVLVPAPQDADHVALFSSSMARAAGLGPADAVPAAEVARFSLRGEDR